MANCITLVVADKVKDIFRKYPEQYFVNFLYTIYLLSFVYLARIKIFPHKNKEKNYNWLIDNMFSFYEFVFQQTSQTPNQQHIKEIKKQVVGQIDLFFFLFEYYQILNNLLYNSKIASGEFYEWMFYDEIKSTTTKPLFTSFMEQYEEYTTKSEFSVVEKKILHYILPADILIKYLFIDADPFLITDNIIANIYEKENIERFLKAFSKGK